MSGLAVLENVRRYRTIASLCRQTATFRPVQKSTLLEQAFEWERLAMASLKHTLRFAMGNRCPCLKSGKRWQRQTLANKTSATFEGFTFLEASHSRRTAVRHPGPSPSRSTLCQLVE